MNCPLIHPENYALGTGDQKNKRDCFDHLSVMINLNTEKSPREQKTHFVTLNLGKNNK